MLDRRRVAGQLEAPTSALELPEDLQLPPPEPPDSDLLVTAYDMMHAVGIDIGPFAKLFDTLKDRIEGPELPLDSPTASFENGIRAMAVLDAIRVSSASRRWLEVVR